MQKKSLEIQLLDFHQPVFHNIGIGSDVDEFDDLTDNPEAKAYAHRAANTSSLKFNISELEYQAIDYVFLNPSLENNRFNNKNFPAWYGATDLKTTFYETIHHWKMRYIVAPHFRKPPKFIPAIRRVFTVNCDAKLIDLRIFKLTNPDPASYTETQRIALKFHQHGDPGLITQSARLETGENIVIFKKEILSSPKHHDDYIYEYDQITKQTSVKQVNSEIEILILEDD